MTTRGRTEFGVSAFWGPGYDFTPLPFDLRHGAVQGNVTKFAIDTFRHGAHQAFIAGGDAALIITLDRFFRLAVAYE